MRSRIPVFEHEGRIEYQARSGRCWTNKIRPGAYIRVGDRQVCEGGGWRGRTLTFAHQDAAAVFAREIGGQLYRTRRGFEAAAVNYAQGGVWR